jgi:hypothetical protein
MAMHSRIKKVRVALLVLLGVAITLRLADELYVRLAPRWGVQVTISKETTFITEPLRPDGYPDYVAALNERSRKGVTPENNAVVAFFRTMGPEMVQKEFRDQYCKLLGITAPPEKGVYFVTLNKYVETLKSTKPGSQPDDELRRQLDSAMKRPWTATEFPSLARWLSANQQPMDLLVEASTRPRWYDPMVRGENGSVLDAEMPTVCRLFEATRALAARAMQQLQDGDIGRARSDLLAAHRLARLAGQRPTLVEGLVAATADGMACVGDQALLQHVRLTAAQAAKMRADLAALPPLPKMTDKIATGERFQTLDLAAELARGKDKSSQEFNEVALNTVGVDWDVVFRTSNKICDRVVAAARKPTPAQRAQAYADIDIDLRSQIAAARSWKFLVMMVLFGRREHISEVIGLAVGRLCMPSLVSVIAEDRGNMRFDLTKLAFALAEYRARHGSYPAKLADLVPECVAAVPKDIFSGGALHYKPQAGGYLLYSVGPNGKDDGGRNQYDDPNDKKLQGCDDIAVRIVPEGK